MKTLLVLGIAMCGSAELSAQSKENAATKIITGQYGFENEQEYEGWKAQNSSLSFSDAHYKQGQRSLCWSWKKKHRWKSPALKGCRKQVPHIPEGYPKYMSLLFIIKTGSEV